MDVAAHTANLLTTRLRDETREAHERVEAALVPLTQSPSLDDYAELLVRWNAFFTYWEPAVAGQIADAALAADFQSRSKLPWLAADLSALRADGSTVRFDPSRLPVLDWATALGGIYVVEGSTLGGQVLCKRFGDALSISPGHGLQYFNSYGPRTAERWRETKAMLNDSRWTPLHGRVIDAARRTFSALTDFFSSPLPFRTI